MVAPSIQRIEAEGKPAEIIVTEVDGRRLNGPNDLVFGADGRLYFTDPGTYDPKDPQPSYLFVLEPDGRGRLLAELVPPTFPNGIAVEADGSVVWAESYTGMVRRLRLESGRIEGIAPPRDRPTADGTPSEQTASTSPLSTAANESPLTAGGAPRRHHPHQLRFFGRDSS
jgi:gluconolactonase